MAKTPASTPIGKISLVSLAIAATICSTSANAQLTQNITIGNPKALALGHAVTADPPGIDSIHFNPAGLAKIQGRQQQLKLLAAHITFEAQFGESEIPEDRQLALCSVTEECDINDPDDVASVWPEDNNAAGRKSETSDPVLMLPGAGLTPVPFLAVPFGGIAVEDPNYGWTFATSVYSPQAIGYERGENDPATYQGKTVGISRITYFSPSVGFHFNDELMIGASIGFSWQGLGIETRFRAPDTVLAYIADLSGDIDETGIEGLELNAIQPYDTVGTLTMELEDALSLSFNLGVLWEPTEWISFGFVYQSEAKSDLEGDFEMIYTDGTGTGMDNANWLAMTEAMQHNALFDDVIIPLLSGGSLNAQKSEKGSVTLEYILPQHISFGTSVKVLPDLKLNFDVKWTDYDTWESLDFKFDQDVDFLTIASIFYELIPGDNADPNEMRIPRQYESEWNFAIGLEYEYNDNLLLRCGYEPRNSVIPDDRVDLLAPIAGADLYSFGFGYRLDAYSQVDFAFGYLTSEFDADAGESQNANSNKSGEVVYNPYAYQSIAAQTTAYLFALSYDTKF